jgi:hypothetical protein
MNVREEHLLRCRRECDERRRYLARLQLLGKRLREDAGQLLGEMARAGAAGGVAAAEPLIERHSRLSRSIAEIEQQTAAAHHALALAELELRRHELALAHRSGDRAGGGRGTTTRFRFAPPLR